jgi:hypothetical protein
VRQPLTTVDDVGAWTPEGPTLTPLPSGAKARDRRVGAILLVELSEFKFGECGGEGGNVLSLCCRIAFV